MIDLRSRGSLDFDNDERLIFGCGAEKAVEKFSGRHRRTFVVFASRYDIWPAKFGEKRYIARIEKTKAGRR